MPYMSADHLITAFRQYNQIIREVATSTGALLIEAEESIPGNPQYFHDSVHFTDEGSRRQADRVVEALKYSPEFRKLVSTYNEG